METHIRNAIELNASLDFPEVNFSGFSETLVGINEVLLKDLLTNVVIYILSLQKSNSRRKITLHCESDSALLLIDIRAIGFVVEESIQNGTSEGGASMYTDLLRYSKLKHIFAAHKIASKLNSEIHIDFTPPDEHNLSISLPRRFTSSKRHL